MKFPYSSMLQRPRRAAGLVLLSLWLAAPTAQAQQAPGWTQLATGVPVSSGAFSYVLANATDAAGNVYLVGQFIGTVGFGNTQLTSSTGVPDGFVAKWNSATGTFAWAVPLVGTAAEKLTAVAVANGALYVGGDFSSASVTFGAFTLTNVSASGTDVFVAKLTDAGTSATVAWVQPLSGAGSGLASALAVSGSNVWAAGSFNGASLVAGATTLVNAGAAGSSDAFLVKLLDGGTTGSVANATSFGGPGFEEARALALSGSSVYVAGDFTSATLPVSGTVLINASTNGTSDVFVLKLQDAPGAPTVQWAQQAGSASSDTGDALALSGSSLYVAGSFGAATATFGTTVLTNANAAAPAGSTDAFVAKLTDAGASSSFIWARSGGGDGAERARGVAVRGSNVYIVGGYGFPTATFGTTVLTNRGTGQANDTFVAKLTDGGTSGAYAWAQSAGGPAGESAFCVALTGNLVAVSGGVASQATFGPLTAPVSGTATAAFVATILDATLTATVAPTLAGAAFMLFPNPARAAATVQLAAVPGISTATLTLRDALGRTLRTETVALPAAGLRHELDLTGLASGLYTVQVRAGVATATQRLVVE